MKTKKYLVVYLCSFSFKNHPDEQSILSKSKIPLQKVVCIFISLNLLKIKQFLFKDYNFTRMLGFLIFFLGTYFLNLVNELK